MEIDVQERIDRAKNYFKQGYNCCQSVVLAFSDITGMDEKQLICCSTGFGGGMGRMREVCGTVSAMTFLSGFISPVPTPADQAARKANYALVQQFAKEFREQNGSIICRELLGLGSAPHIDNPQPSERTPQYYQKRPCAEIVGISASIIANYLKQSLYP